MKLTLKSAGIIGSIAILVMAAIVIGIVIFNKNKAESPVLTPVISSSSEAAESSREPLTDEEINEIYGIKIPENYKHPTQDGKENGDENSSIYIDETGTPPPAPVIEEDENEDTPKTDDPPKNPESSTPPVNTQPKTGDTKIVNGVEYGYVAGFGWTKASKVVEDYRDFGGSLGEQIGK